MANSSAIAAEAITRIGLLYDIEREIRGKPIVLRREIRQTQARPLMDDLHRWFNKILTGLSLKSDTAVAIRYALSRWRALTRYLDDGSIEKVSLNFCPGRTIDNDIMLKDLEAYEISSRSPIPG